MIHEYPVGHSGVVQDAGQFFTARAVCASQNIEQFGPCSVNPQSHHNPQIGPHTFQNDQGDVPLENHCSGKTHAQRDMGKDVSLSHQKHLEKPKCPSVREWMQYYILTLNTK